MQFYSDNESSLLQIAQAVATIPKNDIPDLIVFRFEDGKIIIEDANGTPESFDSKDTLNAMLNCFENMEKLVDTCYNDNEYILQISRFDFLDADAVSIGFFDTVGGISYELMYSVDNVEPPAEKIANNWYYLCYAQ